MDPVVLVTDTELTVLHLSCCCLSLSCLQPLFTTFCLSNLLLYTQSIITQTFPCALLTLLKLSRDCLLYTKKETNCVLFMQ